MNRPYITCHMLTSIDGKITGDFLYRPECTAATEVYYAINRELKKNGFICGRVTMEESFTNGWYPDITVYNAKEKTDCVPKKLSSFYAVAFDPKGKLGWKSERIVDDDPGYGGAQIIEVLTKQADPRYLGYLEHTGIPYIFAGETEIDVALALSKLKDLIGVEALLLEGGSTINGAFQRAGVIDELNLVIAPTVADKNDKPLFMNSTTADFELTSAEKLNDVLVLNYKKRVYPCESEL